MLPANAQDAMYHATFKSELRKEGPASKKGGAAELRKKVQNVYKGFIQELFKKASCRSCGLTQEMKLET